MSNVDRVWRKFWETNVGSSCRVRECRVRQCVKKWRVRNSWAQNSPNYTLLFPPPHFFRIRMLHKSRLPGPQIWPSCVMIGRLPPLLQLFYFLMFKKRSCDIHNHTIRCVWLVNSDIPTYLKIYQKRIQNLKNNLNLLKSAKTGI